MVVLQRDISKLTDLETSVTNDNVKVLEQKKNGTMETIQENHSENDEVRQRRDFMKTMGKESRHNVISRKDSLILSPDQPPTRIEEAIEVSYLKTVNFDSIRPVALKKRLNRLSVPYAAQKLQFLNYKRFKKIARIRSHHLHLQ